MYNEEFKKEWMETLGFYKEDEIKKCQYLFDRIGEVIEAPAQKDLSILSGDEIRKALSRFDYMTYARARRDVSRINLYLRWAGMKRGEYIHDSELLSARSIPLDESYRKNLVFTQEELRSFCSIYPVASGYLQSVVCSLAWLGYHNKDMLKIKSSEVKIADEIMTIQGRVVPDGFVRETLEYYFTANKFYQDNAVLYKANSELFLSRVCRIDSAKNDKAIDGNYINFLMKAQNPHFSKQVTLNSLNISGSFERLRAYESTRPELKEIPISIVKKLCYFTDRRSCEDRLEEYYWYKVALGLIPKTPRN